MGTASYGSGSSGDGRRAAGALAAVALLITLAWGAAVGVGLTGDGALAIDARVTAFDGSVFLAQGLAIVGVVTTTALFAGLYAHSRERVPTGAAVAFGFVPVYAVLALIGYGATLALPEAIATFEGDLNPVRPAAVLVPGIAPASGTDRALAALITVAHAVLALPALGFGGILVGEWYGGLGGVGRLLGGLGLLTAGVAWLVGPARLVVPALGYATTAGTALFALALVGLTVDLLR